MKFTLESLLPPWITSMAVSGFPASISKIAGTRQGDLGTTAEITFRRATTAAICQCREVRWDPKHAQAVEILRRSKHF